MKYMNFAIRTVSLLLILGVLWQYQHIAASRAAVVAERQQRIDEVEAYNAALTEQALAVLDEIVSAQSTEVDTVSGATFSSTGLIDAAVDALGKAAAG